MTEFNIVEEMVLIYQIIIKIKFFGVLAGIASTNETSFEIPAETNSDAIKEHFESIFTGFKNQQYQLALNQQLLNAKNVRVLCNGAETYLS